MTPPIHSPPVRAAPGPRPAARVSGTGTRGVAECHTVPMSGQRTFTAAVHQEEDWFVAQCLEIDVASQGQTIPDALANLREAVALYLEEAPDAAVTSTPLVTAFQVPDTAA